jgi:signal transduction histidine kinase
VVLSERVVPKREVVIQISEAIQTLNRTAFVQQQSAVAKIYRESQQRVWRQFGFALLGSVGIALLATIYAGGLERRLQRQRERDVQLTRELQDLSAKLITAQEEERRRIARELHDEVGQVLTAVKVELSLVQRKLDAAGSGPPLLAEAQAIADSALATVRDLSHLLHPSLLDDLGLAAALEWYLRGFARRQDVRAELVHDHSTDRLRPDVEVAAYRIVQEALTNVARHAHATSCRVYLQRLPATLLLTIEDDGVGFDPEQVDVSRQDRGLGLIGIRERVAQLRGTLRIDSAPGTGTRLTVELPAASVAAADGAAARQSPALEVAHG